MACLYNDIANKPKIFNVNWFRTDDNGNFIWPGFGDNLRVLDWIIDRCEGKVDAKETEIGYIPYAEDINIEGLEGEVSLESLNSILEVEKELWQEDAKGIEEFYAKFGDKIPAVLAEELAIDTEKALDIFYTSKVYQQLSDERYGLYLMSDKYIVEDILNEINQFA